MKRGERWLLVHVVTPVAVVLAATAGLCVWSGSPAPLVVLIPGGLWLGRALPAELRAYRASPPGNRRRRPPPE